MAATASHPRNGRLVRILCDVAAALAVLTAVVFGANAAVSNGFNPTAAMLQKNLTTYTALVAGKSNTSLSSLTASQTQVDAQLADAQSSHAIQLPHVRSTIADAVTASAALDKKIAALKAASSGTTSQGANVTGKSGSSSDSSSDSGSSSSDAAKQKKLDALLKQNSSANSSNEGSTSTSPDSSTTKPW
jgi:hypothetical protein